MLIVETLLLVEGLSIPALTRESAVWFLPPRKGRHFDGGVNLHGKRKWGAPKKKVKSPEKDNEDLEINVSCQRAPAAYLLRTANGRPPSPQISASNVVKKVKRERNSSLETSQVRRGQTTPATHSGGGLKSRTACIPAPWQRTDTYTLVQHCLALCSTADDLTTTMVCGKGGVTGAVSSAHACVSAPPRQLFSAFLKRFAQEHHPQPQGTGW